MVPYRDANPNLPVYYSTQGDGRPVGPTTDPSSELRQETHLIVSCFTYCIINVYGNNADGTLSMTY